MGRDRAGLEEEQRVLSQRCHQAEEVIHTLREKLMSAEHDSQSLQSKVTKSSCELARLLSSIQLTRAQVSVVAVNEGRQTLPCTCICVHVLLLYTQKFSLC